MARKLLHLAFGALLGMLAAGCDEASGRRPAAFVTIEGPQALELSLRELPPDALRSLGLRYGLAVVKAAGPAERAGLRIGDVVYGVNQERVGSLEEFNRLLAQRGSRGLGFLVRRGTTDFYVAVDPPKGAPKETLLRT